MDEYNLDHVQAIDDAIAVGAREGVHGVIRRVFGALIALARWAEHSRPDMRDEIGRRLLAIARLCGEICAIADHPRDVN